MSYKHSHLFMFPLVMSSITILAGLLATIPSTSAEDITPVDDEINITVDSACTMGKTLFQDIDSINPGETEAVGKTRIAAYCNDNNGYAIYAIGYTNGEYGNTNMINTNNPSSTIPTGTSSTLGNASYWNVKLTPGTATTSTAYIPTIENNFTTNTNIPDDYTKVASYPSTTISQTQDPTESGSYFDTTYELHTSTTQPAGFYTGQVQYVMVHPVGTPAPTFMQNTAAIKARLVNYGDTMQAIDKRDGKKYWITKLADGNIWMTQNLDLDLSTSKELTPADTDIRSNWTPANSTLGIDGFSVSGWQGDNTTPYSTDPGNVYYYSSGTTDNDEQYTSLEICRAAHPDCSAHNHVGNYYNWSAAVASNDTSGTATNYNNAPDSLCPAGWRLPIARDSNNTAVSREWNALLVAENIMDEPTGESYAINGFLNIRTSPLYLNRAGDVAYYGGLSGQGAEGSYWSSTVYNSGSAYDLYFKNGYVNPAHYTYRSNGLSIRCLAR